MDIKEKRFLICLFLAALSIRLFLIAFIPEHKSIFPDSVGYIAISKNIIEGKGFTLDDNHKALRMPLYPLFLAMHRILFGNDLLPVKIMQAILGAISCLFVFLLAKMLLNDIVGKIAGVILAVHPYIAFSTILILTETLAIFLILLEVILIVFAIKKKSLLYICYAGLVGGLVSLLHPGHFLSWILILPAFTLTIKNKVYLNLKLAATLFIVFNILPIVPWTLRNYLIFDRFIPLTTSLGYALYDTYAPSGKSHISGESVKLSNEVKNMDEIESDIYLRKKTLEIIAQNPLRAVYSALDNFVLFWNVVPNFREYRNPFYIVISAVFTIPIFIFAFLCLWRYRHNISIIALIIAPILYYTFLHIVLLGSIRYRLPIEPYIIILTSCSFYELVLKKRIAPTQASNP